MKTCPICGSPIKLYCINLEESVSLCSRVECVYPFGLEPLQYVNEDTMDRTSDSAPKEFNYLDSSNTGTPHRMEFSQDDDVEFSPFNSLSFSPFNGSSPMAHRDSKTSNNSIKTLLEENLMKFKNSASCSIRSENDYSSDIMYPNMTPISIENVETGPCEDSDEILDKKINDILNVGGKTPGQGDTLKFDKIKKQMKFLSSLPRKQALTPRHVSCITFVPEALMSPNPNSQSETQGLQK